MVIKNEDSSDHFLLGEEVRKLYHDITGQIARTEEPTILVLNKTIKFLCGIIAQMPGYVYWLDRDNVYLGCNEQHALNAKLKSADEIRGKKNSDLPWAQHADKLNRINTQVITTKHPYKIEEFGITNEHPEGGIYFSEKKPLLDDRGDVIGVLGISLDITELKNAQNELIAAKEKAELANHIKNQLIENMQHDIRTPLGGVLALLQELASAPGNAHISKLLLAAAASLGQLLNYCNEILEVANINFLGDELKYEVVDTKKFFSQPIDLERASAMTKNVALVLNVDEKLPPLLKVDKIRVEKIIINLIGNALKFTEKGSVTLSVKLVNKDDHQITLKIEVRDTGIGIAEDKVGLIFDKFVKLNPSNQGIYKGTGLGLFYVKKFTEDMQGNIEVVSKLGQGTAFILTLSLPLPLPEEKPIYDEHEIDTSIFSLPLKFETETDNANTSPAAHKDDAPKKDENPNVLFIEDDDIVRMTVKAVLEKIGVNLFLAIDVRSGKEAILKQTYDLVISDLGLPDGTGFDIIDWVKSDKAHPNQDTPFVVLTANNSPEKRDIALDKGFLDVFQKPLMIDSAKKMLELYCHQKTESTPLLKPEIIKPEVINMARTCQLINDTEKAALSFFDVLVVSLEREKQNLVVACMANDIPKTRDILHKLSGSLSCFALPALQQARDELHSAVKETQKLGDILQEYNHFFNEMVNFENEVKKLKDRQ